MNTSSTNRLMLGVRFDEKTTGQVPIDGTGLFVGDGDLVRDLAEARSRAIKVISTQIVDVPERLDVVDVEREGVPSIPWRVDAVWGGSDEGRWGSTVDAPDAVLAVLAAHSEMAASDRGFDEAGKPLSDHAALLRAIERNTVHPPIPLVMRPEALSSIVDLATAGRDHLPTQAQEAVDALSAARSGPADRRGPADRGGDIVVEFEADKGVLVGDDGVVLMTQEELEGEKADAPAGTDPLAWAISRAARTVASRLVSFEAFSSDSEYMDRLDATVENLVLTGFGKVGELRSFSADALWHGDEDEPWSDDVAGVDEEDATWDAAMGMAVSEHRGIAKGMEGFEQFADAVESHDIAVLPQEAPEADFLRVVEVLAACDRSQLPLRLAPLASALDGYHVAKATYDAVLQGSRDQAASLARAATPST